MLCPVTASMTTTAFALSSPSLQVRCCTIRACATPPDSDGIENQYNQYASRDRDSLARELSIARALPARQRHHQVFLRPETERTFRSAASRYLDTLRKGAIHPGPLWILHSRADPTFGKLRGEPSPARAMLVEPAEGGVGKWVAALDRAGRGLSPYPSHFVDWGVVGTFGGGKGCAEDEVVACEIVNADWRGKQNVAKMKECMLIHAEDVVTEGNARLFHVLQSIDEPTCFKTVEVYSSVEALHEHMVTWDPQFAESIMEWRAAVNRVRQLYQPLFSLLE